MFCLAQSPATAARVDGLSPVVLGYRSRTAQAELAAATAVIEMHSGSAPPPITGQQLREVLARVGGIVGLLEDADADERREFYQEIGLNLVYQRIGGRERVTASLGVEFLRVGGGTTPLRTQISLSSKAHLWRRFTRE